MKEGRSELPSAADLGAPPLPHIDMRFIRLCLGFRGAAVSDGSLERAAAPSLMTQAEQLSTLAHPAA